MQNERNGQASMRLDGSNGPDGPQAALKDIVRKALLELLNDPDASAAAKASAGRTLLEYFADESAPRNRRGADMSSAELDAAISLFEKR